MFEKEVDMNVFEKSLALLDEYFSKTSPSVVEEQLNLVDQMQIVGPALDHYFMNFGEVFQYEDWLCETGFRKQKHFNVINKIPGLTMSFIVDNLPAPVQNVVSNIDDEFDLSGNQNLAA